MKTIFITGASGLMGTEMTEALIAKGYNVVGTDSKPNTFVSNPNYTFIQANIEDKDKITSAMEKNKVDAVVHLACTVDNDFPHIITPMEEKIASMVDKYIYKAAVGAGIKDFILISTHQVYAAQKTREPIRETADVKPATDYAKIKFESEKTFSKAIAKSGTVGVIARVCPVYSKDFVENLKSRIYDPKDGCSYIYGYGDYGFSFCYVHNLVDFVLGILNVQSGMTYQGIYNVCDSKPIAAKDIVEFLRTHHKLGAVIQKNYGTDSIKLVANFGNKAAKTDYRYNDVATVCSNISYDNTKAQRISTFRWKLSNIK